MKRFAKPLLLTTAIVVAMSPGLRALAATTDNAPLGYTVQDEMLRTSPEALATVAHVQAARLALMNEDYEAARTHVSDAIAALDAEEIRFQDLMLPDTAAASDDPVYLPYTVAVVAIDREGLSRVNELALQRAYGAPESAEPGDTLLVPHLEHLAIAVTASLLPADESMTHLVEARQHLDAGEYAEANRSLLSLERSIIFRSYELDALPAQYDIQ
ncbi:YfdX family protein [Roseibacterium sp. SDUM158016]|jgi:hypothetical protein|uniref:YfdX family protein n=1 Tax=Roseicyclus sediminis TaxID=2980997 RepID=UPI0021CFB815|nr:YfdX family protein [Roseibacterium sp. SDUM158016]MCU4654789.1 YfdX family protein [Roseibacterium sp. SDUM158016]